MKVEDKLRRLARDVLRRPDDGGLEVLVDALLEEGVIATQPGAAASDDRERLRRSALFWAHENVRLRTFVVSRKATPNEVRIDLEPTPGSHEWMAQPNVANAVGLIIRSVSEMGLAESRIADMLRTALQAGFPGQEIEVVDRLTRGGRR